ncbi:MAG: hypothetical protein QOG31_212 [Thermoplasmata archaeon]|jgi:hypothetical protein|nr:hypothetical protein [Thermoplasmata archaeon]
MGQVLVLPDTFIGPPAPGEAYSSSVGVPPGWYEAPNYNGPLAPIAVQDAAWAFRNTPGTNLAGGTTYDSIARTANASSSKLLLVLAGVAALALALASRRGA